MIKKNNLLWKWEKESIITTNGNYSKIYRINLKTIFELNQKDYENCIEEFNYVLKLLPENCFLHKQDVFVEDFYEYLNKINKSTLLDQGYHRYYNEYEYQNHTSFLFVTQGLVSLEKQNSFAAPIFRKNLVPKELLSNEVQNSFFSYNSKLEYFLKESKYFNVSTVGLEEYLKIYNSYTNLDFSKNITAGTISQNKGVFSVGNNFVNSFAVNSLSKLPNQYNTSYFDKEYQTKTSKLPFSLFYPLGVGLKFNHIVNQVYYKENLLALKQRYRIKMNQNNSFMLNEPANVKNAEEYKLFLNKIEDGFTPIKYHANIITWSNNLDSLQENGKKITAAFGKIKLDVTACALENASLFNIATPGNIGSIGFKDQMFDLFTEQAAALNIYETIAKDSPSDFGIRLSDRLSGRPLHVDISDLPMKKGITNNKNKIIFGPSSSGKSFFTNHLINNYLLTGAHCLLVDVGDSYDRLCKIHKGKYFKYTIENPIAFNPFFINGELQPHIEKKESLLVLLFTLWKKEVNDHSKDEYAILSKSIVDFYIYINKEQKFSRFDIYFEFMKNIFAPTLLKENKKKYKLLNFVSFFNVLEMFYKGGEYDYLLNSETDLDLLNEKLIVFELDNIKDHSILFPVVTIMIMETFISKMRKLKNTRKVILIEEAWKAISKDGMAEFLNYLYRTVRKHDGEAMLVSQQVDDIVGNEFIKDTILKNCGAKILLDMSEYVDSFDEIQAMLSLSDHAKNQVLSLNKNRLPGDIYKEVFIGLGNEGNVYGVRLSKEEYAAYTTVKREKERLDVLEEKYGSIEMAINIFAEELRRTA
ncbi:TraG family conjugative transposon ATPase (plasmid) [Tenacibaculum finnmarkense]|nr:TraG family conjugative transposon ATPase [Tenacibaculum finnmarkense]